PLLLLAAALSVPGILIADALYQVRKKRFAKQMAIRGRVMLFADFAVALENGKGTVICEWKTPLKGPGRLWWTGDDLSAKSPFPITSRSDVVDPNVKALPFTRWCFDGYINPSEGKALLVVVNGVSKELKRTLDQRLKDVRRVDVPTLATEGW